MASLSQERAVTGRNELTLQADVALAVANEPFDLLLVPGGPGVKRCAPMAGRPNSPERTIKQESSLRQFAQRRSF